MTCGVMTNAATLAGVKERCASLSLGRLLNNPTRVTTLPRVFARLCEAPLEWPFATAIGCPRLECDQIFNGLIEQVVFLIDAPLFNAGSRCS